MVAVAAIWVKAPVSTQGQNTCDGLGNSAPIVVSTPARKRSANGHPNRKRTWVAPAVPSVAVSSRCVALRTVCAPAAIKVKTAQSTALRRLLRRDHVVHVHVARALPAIGDEIVDHAGLVDHTQPMPLEHGLELVGGDEFVPTMGATRQPAQHVFGTDDREREALDGAVER